MYVVIVLPSKLLGGKGIIIMCSITSEMLSTHFVPLPTCEGQKDFFPTTPVGQILPILVF